eukprot:10416803-Alexandrium_andersonii.AAC.1
MAGVGSAPRIHGTCDGKPLLSYAKKAPTLKIASKGAAVDQGKLTRECLVALVDKLVKYPQFIVPIYSVAYSSDFPIPTQQSSIGSGEWNPEAATFRQIPKGWMAM